ncbi:MAG: VCBS repeat-containing protein, partial [Bacteroidia bacterium]|nr:VCBS repeat-containing protein [Bacteroidia bacterium]
DLADINNDGYTDLIVLDMNSDDHLRSKRMMATMSTMNFQQLVKNGYHYQYMINTLQYNNGLGMYSEIAQLAGISKTDWSWAPLFADFDNDGYKDLFITNGIKKDVTDNDFRIKMESEIKQKGSITWTDANALIPSSTIPNIIFQNAGNLRFKNLSEKWGMTNAINSNGVAYADLDQDGDLEIIVNNMDTTSFIYKNNSQETKRSNYIDIQLKGPSNNPFAVGSEVYVYCQGKAQLQKQFPARGFQSSVDYTLHFGLGNENTIDSILVYWGNDESQRIKSEQSNQKLLVQYSPNRSSDSKKNEIPNKHLFKDVSKESGLNIVHVENDFDDFLEEVLLPHKQSELGPLIATGDVNADGLEDFYVGGAFQQSGRLFIQQYSGQFKLASSQPWKSEQQAEDMASLFFDADNDGDLDLYVVSGGAIFQVNNPILQDRLYTNDGKGNFIRNYDALPRMFTSGHNLCVGDIDKDGDLDLFVGGRLMPGKYPLAPRSYLLLNTDGIFQDVTETRATSLMNPGLVNDAKFSDFDHDGDLDLIVVGEWMPLSFYRNANGSFTNVNSELNLTATSGWWTRIEAVDVDLDGDQDYILGNVGDNNKYQPKVEEPLYLYVNDFDHNGSLDIYLAKEKGNVKLPVRGRECSAQQMPGILQKFPTYKDFGQAQVQDILGIEEFQNAMTFDAKIFSSSILVNQGGSFILKSLPVEAQFSQVNGILTEDFNNDGYPDILIAGNNFSTETETARYDASPGLLLLNDKKGEFTPIPNHRSGLNLTGNVKSLTRIETGTSKNKSLILVGNNNSSIQVLLAQ